MRSALQKASFPSALLVATVATSLGCRACADDRHSPPPAAAASVADLRAANAELTARCTSGLVPPAEFAAVTEIPSLGGAQTFVQDVNDDDVAVGSSQVASGSYHAFRYTAAGGVQDLGALSAFGGQSFASAIGPDGAIGGHSDHADGTGTLFGYRYTPSDGRVEVCAGGCSVWDVNGGGQVVGLVQGRDTTTWQAFVWSAGAGLTGLGTLGGARSSATGISEAGLVVGNAQVPGSGDGDVGHAFIYDSRAPHPAMQDLNARARTPRWLLRGANDVNAEFVVGYGTHAGQSRAFRFDLPSGEIEDLGTIGAGSSVGWAVDDAGDVVGWVAIDAHRNTAFVHGPSLRGMHALNDFLDPSADWDLQQANGINNRGTIVGWGYHHGAAVGFKLTLPICRPRR